MQGRRAHTELERKGGREREGKGGEKERERERERDAYK